MENTINTPLNRRSFLQVTALAGGGLMIGLASDAVAQGQRGGAAPALQNPNNYITVNPDNTFIIVAKNPETGQGIRNALPQLIADEFDVEWSQVKIQQADRENRYPNQIEGGSTAIPNNYTPMRQVGAGGRALMIAAAAAQWNVPATELTTTGNGSVRHAASNRTATYASLAARAATITPPTTVTLKEQKDFKIIGKPLPGVDNLAIVTGKPAFSIDVNPPGMLHAVYEKCPTFGGKVISANVDEIKKMAGVRHVFIVEPPPPAAAGARGGGGGGGGATWPSAVAIVADNWWQAESARKALKVNWDLGAAATQNTPGFTAQAKQAATAQANQAPAGGGQGAANVGDVDAAFASAAKVIEAEYYFPLLSHAPLEPQNSTAHFNNGRLEIWSPSQIPNVAAPATAAGIDQANVTMHLVRAGGGFGRRLVSEYDIEVAKVARLVADERAAAGQPSVPVKVLWSREEDLAHDNYRPAGYHFFKAGLDASGKLVAFRDFVPSFSSVVPGNEYPRGFVANFRAATTPITPFSIPTGALRAPGTNGISFVMQGFMDEVAVAAGKDPLQYRLDVLASPLPAPAPVAGGPPAGGGGGGFNADRARGVLEAVRDMSNWNTARARLPRGTGMGVAFQFAHAGYVAYVVEAAVDNNKRIKINRAWCAVDIGNQIVNPSMATNLVQGGFVEGMSHTMFWEITINNGAVVQKNFPEYNPTRMPQVPASIEVKFLQTNFPPTGLGEPSLPPAVPAIVNAIAHATGVRLRSLPLGKQGYSWAT